MCGVAIQKQNQRSIVNQSKNIKILIFYFNFLSKYIKKDLKKKKKMIPTSK